MLLCLYYFSYIIYAYIYTLPSQMLLCLYYLCTLPSQMVSISPQTIVIVYAYFFQRFKCNAIELRISTAYKSSIANHLLHISAKSQGFVTPKNLFSLLETFILFFIQLISCKKYLECRLVQWRLSIHPCSCEYLFHEIPST